MSDITPMTQAVSSGNIAAVEILLLKGSVCFSDAVMTYQKRLTDADFLLLA